MCWRVLQFGCYFTWSSAIIPFLLLACLGPSKRIWLYSVYIIGLPVFLVINLMATAYLHSQMLGAWTNCWPPSITDFWLGLALYNPAYFLLLGRLMVPGVRFAGGLPGRSIQGVIDHAILLPHHSSGFSMVLQRMGR